MNRYALYLFALCVGSAAVTIAALNYIASFI